MCDKVADVCLPGLKLVFDWFVKNKMLEKLYDVVFSNDDIIFVNADSDNVTLFSHVMGINTIDLLTF